MLQISEIVKKTEEMFDLFNEHFYNKELTRPAITVSPDGGHGAYGWCSIHEIWNADEEKYREINLCAEYLDRPMAELTALQLPEETRLLIDRCISEQNALESRYGMLSYQLGFTDCKELFLEKTGYGDCYPASRDLRE